MLLLADCAPAPPKPTGRLRVVTTMGVLADWARLVDLMRREHIKVITTEPQMPSALPDMLVRESGAEVVVLNPLESKGGYVAVLGASTNALINALK
jgi:ABC-type Zn uptake system ZnuABC Zn-binding protein ZnuA